MQHLVGWDGVGSKDSARCVRSDLGHFYDFSLGIEGTVLTSNIMHCTLSYVTLTLHNGRTVAPEAILFESPCSANSET